MNKKTMIYKLHTSTDRLRRLNLLAIAFVLAAQSLAVINFTSPKVFAGGEEISGGTNTTGETDTYIPITGLTVTGDGLDPVPVNLSVDRGQLSMTTTTGLTFTSDQAGSNLEFSGSLADVNAAIATLRYRTVFAETVTLTASISSQGEVFFPENGHLYEVVDAGGPISHTAAMTEAASRTKYGASGYLVTVTSQAENDYISARLTGDGWMGASDAETEGDWKWVTGPETGMSFWQGLSNGSPVDGAFSDWAGGEPNDSSGWPEGEDCAQFYADGSGWNDLHCDNHTLDYYVVEYGAPGDMPSVSSTDFTITTTFPEGEQVPIGSCLDLINVAANMNDHRYDTLKLTSNIDCTGEILEPLFSDEDEDLGLLSFKGTFDGQGHTISNVTLSPSSSENVGFIAATDGATVKNLTISGATVTGDDCVGGLVGRAEATTIQNVSLSLDVDGGYEVGGLVGCLTANNGDSSIIGSSSTGNISGNSTVGGLVGYADVDDGELQISNSFSTGTVTGNSWSIGGIAGVVYGATIANSYAAGAVSGSGEVGGVVGYGRDMVIEKSYASGDVTGTSSGVGGLVGRNADDSTISESYATGDVSGNSRVGGLAGANGGGSLIINSYARGSVEGDSNVGGLVGRCGGSIEKSYATGLVNGNSSTGGFLGSDQDCDVTDSFWDTDTSSLSSSIAGTGKTTTEMKAKTTFTDTATEGLDEPWSFGGVWGITPAVNDGYPCLLWQHNSCSGTDEDADGIPNNIENAGPNGGDANNDGILDSQQAYVASFVNPVTGKYAVLEVDNSCSITAVSINTENTNTVADPGYNYPVGLMNFTVDCGTPGYTTTVKQYYYDVADDNFILRKYNPNTEAYFTIDGANIEQNVLDGQTVTIATYQITDGGELDIDNEANGIIVDPVGLALGSDDSGLVDTGQNIWIPVFMAGLIVAVSLLFKDSKVAMKAWHKIKL